MPSDQNDQSRETVIGDLAAPRSLLDKAKKSSDLWAMGIKNRNRLFGPGPKNGIRIDPEALIELFCEYIQWCEDNPLQGAKLVSYEGSSTLESIPHMRSPTLAGLCVWLGIRRDTWGSWRRRENRTELTPVVEWCESVMWDKKFVGGASGLLNPAVIIRELGLVERQQLDHKTNVVIAGDEANL